MRKIERVGDLTATGRRMAKLIEEQDRCGLTAKQFAEIRGVSPGALGWWRWKLRQRASRSTPLPVLVEAIVVADGAPAIDVVGSEALVVDLGHGRRIEVPHNFDEKHLRRVISAVASC